jgi:hypothetical protein
MKTGERSFVSDRKKEVLCFVYVAKFEFRANGSFVLNRNWRFGRQTEPKRLAAGAGVRALDRLGVILDIFTDSSPSSGARNAKGCVCTWLLPGAAQYSRTAPPRLATAARENPARRLRNEKSFLHDLAHRHSLRDQQLARLQAQRGPAPHKCDSSRDRAQAAERYG